MKPQHDAPPLESRALAVRRRGVIAVMVIGISAPFAVALVHAHTRWYPQGDLAMTELLVRDVGSTHPPLLGLVGRIGTATEPGSHLGPLSFYALWPFYQLFGGQAWSLLAAAACLHVIAAAISLWIALRRGGIRLALGVGAVIVGVMSFLGPAVMIQPWNPFLPVMWWVVFVLSVWSVSCDDIALLPVAVFAGSFCVQTHISYTALVAAGMAFAVASLVAMWLRSERPERMRLFRWAAAATATGIVLWFPPVYQQLTAADGNLSLAFHYFSHPPSSPIGAARALNLMLVHLNPWTLMSSRSVLITTGSTLPGILLLAAWIVSFVAAWRLHERTLLRLQFLLAVALAVGAWSMSRIFGFVWYYLLLWAWCLDGLVVVAIVWTATCAVRRYKPRVPSARVARIAPALVVLVIIGFGLMSLRDALHVEVPPDAVANSVVRGIVQPTVAALRRGAAPGGGRRGTYLVTYNDPVLLGSHAFALVDELDRAGFDVGMSPLYARDVGSSRTLDQDQASAIVHLAVGADIQRWERSAGAVEIVKLDRRTKADRARFSQLLEQARSELSRRRLDSLIPLLESNLFVAVGDPRMPGALRPTISNMIHIGLPEAVFVAPVHATPSSTGAPTNRRFHR